MFDSRLSCSQLILDLAFGSVLIARDLAHNTGRYPVVKTKRQTVIPYPHVITVRPVWFVLGIILWISFWDDKQDDN